MNSAELFRTFLRYLFPEFTNKLTWAVAGAGLLLISSTLIEQIIRAWITSEFDLQLTGANDAYIGLGLVFAALLHNYGFQRESTARLLSSKSDPIEARRHEHDAKKFQQTDQYLCETFLKEHFHEVTTNHSYYSQESDPLLRFLYHGLDEENLFVSEILNSRLRELHSAINEYIDFRAECFFQHGPVIKDQPMRFCMYPELDWDRGGTPTRDQERFYAERSVLLNSIVDKAMKAFRDYRGAIRNELAL